MDEKVDNTPPAVKAVLGKPGKYLFFGVALWFFEVSLEREVHQLRLTDFTKEGLLTPDGWSIEPHAQNAKVFRLEET